jgi:hypothetical protein
MKQESKIKFTILGIVMMLSLPIVWSISLGLNLPSLFFYEFFIVIVGYLIVSICYSVCLAQGLLFLSIGLIETIEQLILSHFYPFFSFSMFRWNILLTIGILFMLGALVERKYIRGRKEEDVTWGDILAPFLFILVIFILSTILLFW